MGGKVIHISHTDITSYTKTTKSSCVTAMEGGGGVGGGGMDMSEGGVIKGLPLSWLGSGGTPCPGLGSGGAPFPSCGLGGGSVWGYPLSWSGIPLPLLWIDRHNLSLMRLFILAES